jgi:hypothetical protein
VYGRDVVLPEDLKYGVAAKERGIIDEEPGRYQYNLVKDMQGTFDKVIVSKEKEQAAYKKYYDKSHKDVSYTEGDLVWYYSHNPKKNLSLKLTRKWEGPYVVKTKTGPVTYRIQSERMIFETHVSLLRKYERWDRTNPVATV